MRREIQTLTAELASREAQNNSHREEHQKAIQETEDLLPRLLELQKMYEETNVDPSPE